MCGFAGLINLAGLSGTEADRRSALAAMGAQLARRGPDDEQFYDDGFLSLVFRRLSIIDLAGGQQPIWNEDHSILSVVNGEIFNHLEIRQRLRERHQFASQSDSEVVVHLYEESPNEMLDQLNGMYALLVWDTRERKLTLARDRLAIKPLFYAQTSKGLLFGSELKALLAHPDCPRELDWSHFETTRGFSGSLNSYVQGVQQLAGGHALHLAAGAQPRLQCYWNIKDYFAKTGESSPSDPADFSQRYGELLQDSVTRQLMSDVPLGLFLSGGIDSSLLAAMAAKTSQQLHCFTVVEENTLVAGDVEQSVLLARQFGFHHHPVFYDTNTILDQLQFGLEEFEFMIWAVERPSFKTEWFLKLELHRYAKTALPGLKVILLGQGADEFAGGYSHSMGNESIDWPHYLQKVSENHRTLRRNDRHIPRYMRPALNESFPATPHDGLDNDFYREMQFRTGLLTAYNLWHEDRTSSCHGIEARVPFLDHRLVELLASVPPALHARLFYNKAIVREQLAKAAPFYPPDKKKVKFYNTGQGDSIKRLRMGVVQRVYPAFRDKYLTRPEAIFSAAKLDAHFRFLQQNPNASDQDINELLDCMAIEVFAGHCRHMASAPPPPGLGRASPLRLWSPPPAAAGQKKAAVDEWTMEL